jgi:Na+/melibiose symporter-like transporter
VLHVNMVEAVWLLICLVGIFTTIMLLIDSMGERETVKDLSNGRQALRLFIVRGNIRRESFRLFMQAVLLLAVLPSALRPGDFDFAFDPLSRDPERVVATAITVAVLSLMMAPLMLLLTSYFDYRDRQKIRIMAAEILHVDSDRGDAAILGALADVGARSRNDHRLTQQHLDAQDVAHRDHDARGGRE